VDVTTVLLIAFLVVLVIVLLQGAMVNKIGFGPFVMTFDHGDRAGGRQGQRVAVVFGVLTVAAASVLVFFVGRVAWSWISDHRPSLPSGAFSSPNAKSESTAASKTATGRWSQTKGELTVTVTRVDNVGGTLRLHVKATNNSNDTMELPTGFLIATDNAEKTYKAAPFAGDWAQSVPSAGSITGIIELVQKVDQKATKLSMSFTVVGGLTAPQGGITVRNIRIPH
jgi:hypothetical protein